MKALIIEDSKDQAAIIQNALENVGFAVTVANSVESAKEAIEVSGYDRYDVILVDLGLPDGNGLSILELKQVGTESDRVPILVLSGNSEVHSKVEAFGRGVDDYLEKPLNMKELVARVSLRVRKHQKSNTRSAVLRLGDVIINQNLLRASVSQNGSDHPVDLTSKEYKILNLLALNQGKIYSRSQVVQHVWGRGVHILDRTVDSHVCGLRKKLGAAATQIECVPGEGYRFRAQNAENTLMSAI